VDAVTNLSTQSPLESVGVPNPKYNPAIPGGMGPGSALLGACLTLVS
jgi:hypothetical protein